MFIKAVPDNKKKRDGYYCSLVHSEIVNGKCVHHLARSFGFIAAERLPYLRAAFNDGDPEEILAREKEKLNGKRQAHLHDHV